MVQIDCTDEWRVHEQAQIQSEQIDAAKGRLVTDAEMDEIFSRIQSKETP